MVVKKKEKWYQPKTRHTGWKKKDTAEKRRQKALMAAKGDALKAGRSLQALSNLSQDEKTKEAAKADAKYFFRLNKAKNS